MIRLYHARALLKILALGNQQIEKKQFQAGSNVLNNLEKASLN
jgi:hypothetical protein